jgi:di/tricarboxylate transporter
VNPIAQRAALDPVVCGLVVTIAVDAVILYPIQTATNLLAYEADYYAAADVRRFGLAMLALTMVVVMLTIPYWGWLGLPLTQGDAAIAAALAGAAPLSRSHRLGR